MRERTASGPMDRDAWMQAYEQRNQNIVAFFSRKEAHRLLVLQDLDAAPPKKTWEALCNFLEAWSTCPSNRIIPRTRVKTRKCDVKPLSSRRSTRRRRRHCLRRSYRYASGVHCLRRRVASMAYEVSWMPAPTPSRRRGDVAGPGALQGESAGPPRAAKRAGHEAAQAPKARPQGPDVRREEEAEEGLPLVPRAEVAPPSDEPKHPRGVLYNRIPKSGFGVDHVVDERPIERDGAAQISFETDGRDVVDAPRCQTPLARRDGPEKVFGSNRDVWPAIPVRDAAPRRYPGRRGEHTCGWCCLGELDTRSY